MGAIIMDGTQLAKETRIALKKRVTKLIERGITPGLTVIMVGDDPGSAAYVRSKEKMAARVSINGQTVYLPAETTQDALLSRIDALNADDTVHGILIQHPMPAHIDEDTVFERVLPRKDVDGFSVANAGALFLGRGDTGACTPKGMLRLLKHYGIPLAGKRAVMVGRSNIVGKPMALLLMNENCTVTIAHSRTQNLAELTREADILCVAIGRPNFITADMVKPGAAVLDVGVNRGGEDGKLVGDVDFEGVSKVAGYLTPMPGGVGPMTIAMLLESVADAAERYGK